MNRPVIALIAAAGTGQRLGAELPKAFVPLAGRCLLERSIEAMVSSEVVTRIIVLVHPQWHDYAATLLEKAGFLGGDSSVSASSPARSSDPSTARLSAPPVSLGAPPVSLVVGGKERADSVWQGLQAIPDSEALVLIHDAARALTPPEMIARVVHALASGAPAVIPVVPVADTIKQVTGDVVISTPSRSDLRAVQTPQGFDLATLRQANQKYFAEKDPGFTATDDASLMEWYGVPVTCVDGDPLAFKITTALDYRLAQSLLKTQSIDFEVPDE